jgi:hypothetical protein
MNMAKDGRLEALVSINPQGKTAWKVIDKPMPMEWAVHKANEYRRETFAAVRAIDLDGKVVPWRVGPKTSELATDILIDIIPNPIRLVSLVESEATAELLSLGGLLVDRHGMVPVPAVLIEVAAGRWIDPRRAG